MITTNGQTLTERQKGLAACACLMAQGNMERLEPAVRQALDAGVTINELKEAFSQLYAYTGFPRSLNALGVLSKVLETSPRGGLEGVFLFTSILPAVISMDGRPMPSATVRPMWWLLRISFWQGLIT